MLPKLWRIVVCALVTSAQTNKLLDLFVHGDKDDRNKSYGCFRIPALVRTRSSAGIIAFAEARVPGGSPSACYGETRIVARISTDDGLTWGPLREIYGEKGYDIGNPSPVADTISGTIHLLFCRNNQQVLTIKSTDEGSTWSNPEDLTSVLKPPTVSGSHWIGTGPPGGVQTTSGRLAVALYYVYADTPYGVCSAFAAFSDDHGQTWRRGKVVELGNTLAVGESQLAMYNSSLIMFMRVVKTYANESLYHHAIAVSHDEGESWSAAQELNDLVAPNCEGSILDVPSTGDLLVSVPSSIGTRVNMTVYKAVHHSPFSFVPYLTLHDGPSGYSSMVTGQAVSTVLNLFENGDKSSIGKISLARFAAPGNKTTSWNIATEKPAQVPLLQV